MALTSSSIHTGQESPASGEIDMRLRALLISEWVSCMCVLINAHLFNTAVLVCTWMSCDQWIRKRAYELVNPLQDLECLGAAQRSRAEMSRGGKPHDMVIIQQLYMASTTSFLWMSTGQRSGDIWDPWSSWYNGKLWRKCRHPCQVFWFTSFYVVSY